MPAKVSSYVLGRVANREAFNRTRLLRHTRRKWQHLCFTVPAYIVPGFYHGRVQYGDTSGWLPMGAKLLYNINVKPKLGAEHIKVDPMETRRQHV